MSQPCPSEEPSRRWRQTARRFLLGVIVGFLAGAFAVAAVVWEHPGLLGSRAASREYPAHAPSALERWSGGIDDVRDAVIRPHDGGGPVATSGAPVEVVRPAAPPEPVLDAPPAAELAGRDLMVPVEGVTKEQLTRSFADARDSRQHEAIDIAAPRNAPVRAVESGTIARLFLSKSGGITIYQFDPTGRFCYYYAHLDRYADGLAEGQDVRKGQIIGYVGVSGNAPDHAPHLHFAIFRLTEAKRWWEGTPIDPFDVFR